MRRRRIKDEGDAKACMAAVRASGVGAVRWARDHGVDARSLNAWRMNLGRRGKARTTLRSAAALVELVPTPVANGEARYALVVGNARLEFGDACSADTLRRVLQVVRTC